MPELRPLRALRYDPRTVGDVGAVLCPPYDVIAPEERERLVARHPRNAVRLELPDGYEVASRLFAEWHADGTLRRDERPMIYVYEQAYNLPAIGDRSATGFFCRLRLEDYGKGVRRHERTHAAPKEDRYRLMQAVRANVSPVMMLYDDGNGGASSDPLLAALTNVAPDVSAIDAAGNDHKLWAVDPAESEAARSLLEVASAGSLTIADGHHRYETALRYCDEARRDGSAADFVLVLLYEATSGGLSVLPTHRVLRGDSSGGDILTAAAAGFDVRRVTLRELMRDVEDGLTFPGVAFGLVTGDGAAVLTTDDTRSTALVGVTAPEALRRLPVAVLDAALETWTGQSVAELVERGRIIYSKDARESVAQVEAGAADAAFLLPPTPIGAVLEVAAAGEVMPQKSTYFEPKAATGLVFNPLSDD